MQSKVAHPLLRRKIMKYSDAKAFINVIGRKDFEFLIEWMGIDAIKSGLTAGITPDYFEESYNGEWDNDEEFTQELLESVGDIPSEMPWYVCIDWKSTAINIMQDYVEEDGYYWRL
jgi:hypothetical protein|tara:strand:- start:1079 stop:1426 length:348 start_codon:yes stop_codon:yes gene_type:complete